MCRILLFPVLVIFPVCVATADTKPEPKPGLTLEAELIQNARFGRQLEVRLVNSGKVPRTVVTDKLRLKRSEDGDKITISLEMTEKRTHKERLVVPPTDSLGLVKLEPGEVAVVRVPAAPKLMNKLDAKAALTVTYEVSEFWGKRFGVWHGKIQTKAPILKE